MHPADMGQTINLRAGATGSTPSPFPVGRREEADKQTNKHQSAGVTGDSPLPASPHTPSPKAMIMAIPHVSTCKRKKMNRQTNKHVHSC
jgi:hypothetical protein